MIQVGTERVQIESTIEVVRGAGQGWRLKPDADWTERDLRDYIASQMADRGVASTMESFRELTVVKAFQKRHGAQAVRIARYVFERLDGNWRGQPVTFSRFCKGSDAYFAEPISRALDA